ILFTDSFYDTFHTMADMMYYCQALALLEIINPLIGLVKTGVVPAVMQVLGRNFILFIILGNLEEMQTKGVVFFIFYLWSTIEVFRYPFYMLACIDTEWKLLTWIRYTIWIPLYPLGALSEAVSIVQAIPIFNETGKFSFQLPFPLEVTVGFPVFLVIYLPLQLL
ncbi:very-long-chain (3R)-3-hydroxyacyl-CoA dehydratase 3-like, partial [Bombina bombina]|uniref:very-long-chain (3R)-3-hydroxyacyl-CoA dehydratase 3-like n=1 Tax=Bombina bombina TaxID=8345 RepID=UPI00235AAC07